MIRPDQIPDKVMAAARVAYQNSESYRVAIAAALNAWPDGYVEKHGDAIILPLPQENQ